MTNTYAITEANKRYLIEWLRGGHIQRVLNALENLTPQSLPLITGEPTDWVKNTGVIPDVGDKKIDLNWGDGTFTNRVTAAQYPWHKAFNPHITEWRLSDTHAQPLQDPIAFEALDDLLGQYWDVAYKEGETGIPQSTEANDILHKMRQLVKPLQPITAYDVTDKMVATYLVAQRATVEEADRSWGRQPGGGLHTNTVKEACRAGLVAALNIKGAAA